MSGKRQNLRDRPRTSKKRREETEMFLKQFVEDRTENHNINMIEEVVVETQDYFYTRKKRSSRRTKKNNNVLQTTKQYTVIKQKEPTTI